MKAPGGFIIYILVLLGNFVNAQSPGYLNHRLYVGLAPRISITGLQSNIIKPVYAAEAGYVYRSNAIALAQLGFSQDKSTLEVYNDYDFDIQLPAQSIKSNEVYALVGLKYFVSDLAPVGSYVSIKLGGAYTQMPYRQWTIKSDQVTKQNTLSAQLAVEKKIYPQLVINFGRQRVFFDRVLVDSGIGSNLGYFMMAKENTWRRRYIFSNILFLQLGASYLL